MPTPTPAHAALVNDPDLGFFKRRALRIKALGIKAIGPTVLRPEPPTPTRADEVIAAKRRTEVEREHRQMIEGELAEIDKHARAVEARLATLAAHLRSFEAQELHRELGMLRELRRAIEGELDRPIMRTAEGREVDDRLRAIVRARTAMLRDSYWRAAERDAASGLHREARRHRVDACRARHVAEHEIGVRSSLPGYTTPWS
jgi:hypothetical protein